MNTRSLAAVLITGVLCAEAAAQEDGLNVSLRVNHGAAYRDGTWVPIDVIVDNRAKDIQGWIEISLFNANGDVQSPRYRVPAESAKFSVKRFRLHCRLTGVDRIRAQIYHKKRAVLDIPLVVQVRPIAQQDFLCLVLDDKAENFGFLSTALYRGMGQNVRFHRESLDTSQLTFLADHQVCYEPFNLIVMGEIDPSRISARHRELLMGYVEQGGTLVVALGANAGLYRGTWVEDWLGVTIGTSSVYNGVELAKGAYNGNTEGARPEREAFVTQMLPRGDEVLFRKDARPLLEVSRPYGAGYVLALAIDAESQVLHRHPEFHAFWRRVAEQAYRPVSLNYGGAASLAAAQLPRVAGVELFPVSSVILYLVLYFTIAIVGNWLFWNYFKRRELAWVCLVVFSFGFTGYAMIFGTQGRAKATEIERLEVLELPGNASAGTLRSLTGILAAGSGYYSGNLGGPGVLAADLQLDGGFQFARGNRPRRFSGPQPFTFIQDGQGHIGNLRIGASEMRFLDITKTIRFDGAITGELVDDEGHVYGTLENNTGLDFSEIRLYHNGMLYRLNTIESGWEIDTEIYPAEVINTGQLQQFNQYGRGTTDMNQFRQQFRNALLADSNASMQSQNFGPNISGYGGYGSGFGYGGGGQVLSLSQPTCLVGWIDNGPLGELYMDQNATNNLTATLLVSEIPVRDAGGAGPRPLQTRILGAQWARLQNAPVGQAPPETSLDDWAKTADILRVNGDAELRVSIGRGIGGFRKGTLLLDLYYCTDTAALRRAWNQRPGSRSVLQYRNGPSRENGLWSVKLRASADGNADPIEPISVSEQNFGNETRIRTRYQIDTKDVVAAQFGAQLTLYPYLDPEHFDNDRAWRQDTNQNQSTPMALVSCTATFEPAVKNTEDINFDVLFQ